LTGEADFKGLCMSEAQVTKKEGRNYKRAVLLAIIVFAAFTAHVIWTKGSADFILKLFHGDFIYISNLLMISFVLTGWLLVYKYLGKLL